LTRREISKAVARGGDFGLLDGGRVLAAAVLRKCLVLELRIDEPAHLGEGNVDRHGDIDRALIGLRHDLKLLGERAIGLGLRRHDARFCLHADEQRDRIGVDLWLRRDGVRRAHLEPEIGHALRSRAERDRAAELAPFVAGGVFDERIVAQPRFQCGRLLMHCVVE